MKTLNKFIMLALVAVVLTACGSRDDVWYPDEVVNSRHYQRIVDENMPLDKALRLVRGWETRLDSSEFTEDFQPIHDFCEANPDGYRPEIGTTPIRARVHEINDPNAKYYSYQEILAMPLEGDLADYRTEYVGLPDWAMIGRGNFKCGVSRLKTPNWNASQPSSVWKSDHDVGDWVSNYAAVNGPVAAAHVCEKMKDDGLFTFDPYYEYRGGYYDCKRAIEVSYNMCGFR